MFKKWFDDMKKGEAKLHWIENGLGDRMYLQELHSRLLTKDVLQREVIDIHCCF